jgi:hypothetical protein
VGLVTSYGGNLAREAERMLLDRLAPNNLAYREAVTQMAGHLRAQLGGPDPTPLERLLVERVVVSWLWMYQADMMGALQTKTLAVGDYFERNVDRAHRRFLAAVKALAQVRRLALPVLLAQINVNQAGCPQPPVRLARPS